MIAFEERVEASHRRAKAIRNWLMKIESQIARWGQARVTRKLIRERSKAVWAMRTAIKRATRKATRSYACGGEAKAKVFLFRKFNPVPNLVSKELIDQNDLATILMPYSNEWGIRIVEIGDSYDSITVSRR